MRRAWLGWAAAILLVGGPVVAQDAAAAQRLAGQITAQSDQMLPDAKVFASRSVLFRGPLEPARVALTQLAAQGQTAIPALAQLLRHSRAQIRANAAYGLSLIGGPATTEPLATAAGDPIPGVRYQVTLALGYTDSAQALVALNGLAGDKDGAVRNAAIQTSGMLRDLLTAETAETPDARFTELVKLAANDAVVQRLVGYGAPAVPALLKALDSDDKGIVFGAAEALARIGQAEAMEPLYNHFVATLDKQPATKFALALTEFRSPDVWPWLVKLLEDKIDAVPIAQYYALQRIGTIDNPDRGKTVLAFLQRLMAKGAHKETIRGAETEVNPVAAACEVLGRIGDASAVPVLDRLIGEAPPPEKSYVKPLAEKAKAAIAKRAGG